MANQQPTAPGGLWAAYNQALATKPLLTKSLTAMVLNGLEEYISQSLAARAPPPPPAPGAKTIALKKGVDYEKVIKMALYGLLVNGPLGHYLYRLVDVAFAGRTGAFAAIGQLVAVNAIAIPIQNYGIAPAQDSWRVAGPRLTRTRPPPVLLRTSSLPTVHGAHRQ